MTCAATPARPTARARRALAGMLLPLALCAGGCIPGYVRLSISSRPNSNGGKPVYVLVRAAERKVFAAESYADVAARLDSPDATVLRAQMLRPGAKQTMYIKKPDKVSLGVFVLFTAPGGPWAAVVDSPLPARLALELAGSQIAKETR